MTIYDWTAEGGVDGANVTVAGSSSSGPILDALVINNASTPSGAAGAIYSAAAASIGTLGVRMTPAASTTYLRWLETGPTADRRFLRRKIKLSAAVAAQATYGSIHNSANGLMGEIRVSTAEAVFAADATGNIAASEYILTVGTTYYVELYVTPNTTTSTGRVEFRVYAADGTTLLFNYDSGTTRNTGIVVGGDARFRAGGVISTTGQTVDDVDGIRFGSLATGYAGPPGNAVPTVSVNANQNVAAGAAVTLTSSASDPDGTIASRAWTFDYPTTGAPTLTGGTTATATFTAGAAGSLYILRHTVTDNGGATASATTEIRVPSTASSVRHLPVDGTGAGTWTKAGGLTTDGATLNDELDTTYIESAAVSATAQTRRVRLAPMASRSALTLSERLWQDVAGATTVKVRLYEGATQRQEWTQAITTTATTYTFAVTTPGAITDWGNLSVEISAAS